MNTSLNLFSAYSAVFRVLRVPLPSLVCSLSAPSLCSLCPLWLILLFSVPLIAATPTAPPQPATGFGGRDYPHASYRMTTRGEAAGQFWIFEPADPAPEAAPVVVFLHGWGAMNPGIYGRWIEHLVRRGHIVIFPRYQLSWITPPEQTTDSAIAAVREALEVLRQPGHVTPDVERFAVVGHSMGGVMTANFAARAQAAGLPRPDALLIVHPGVIREDGDRFGMPLADLLQIAPETLMLVVVGDRDFITGEADAWAIFRRATAVPVSRRNFIRIRSDTHGSPPLIADHEAATSFHPRMMKEAAAGGDADLRRFDGPGAALADRVLEHLSVSTFDVIDHHGYWRLFDALLAAAFDHGDTSAALGGTPQQKDMGEWSDGRPITKPQVTIEP